MRMMLGKTASSLFWMARLLERSENAARMIEAGLRLALTRSDAARDEWESVLMSAGVGEAYQAKYSQFSQGLAIDFLLRDEDNPSTVIALLNSARDSARIARTAITREVWEAINESWMTLKEALAEPVQTSDLPDLLGLIRRQSAIVRGAMHGTMIRNDAFNFVRLGTFIERADNTARILDVKYYLLLPSISHVGSSLDNMQWETILRSVSAHRSYRWLNGPEVTPIGVADYLILSPQMPRSLCFCYNKINDNLRWLDMQYTGHGAAYELAQELAANRLGQSIDTIFDSGIHEFVEDFLVANNRVSEQIASDYNFLDRPEAECA